MGHDLKVGDMVKWTDPEDDRGSAESPGTVTAIDANGLIHIHIDGGKMEVLAHDVTYIDGALTAEDRAELTAFNLVAHSIMREKPGIPPCWLTASAEAKEAAREEARLFIDQGAGMGFGAMTLEMAERKAGAILGADKVKAFTQAEELYKVRRALGNPRAFFAG